MSRIIFALFAASSCIGLAAPAGAIPLSVRDSFRIGSGGTIFCSAQSVAVDKALEGMFDSGYSLTCRDAASPIGKMYKLRDVATAGARINAARGSDFICASPQPGQIEELGAVEITECKLKDVDVTYRAYTYRKGKDLYAAEGLGGYDSVVRLGLRSLVADEPAKGEISIATTGLGDPSAFARVQAGTMAPSKALAEAYRRNNAGSYAEAAEFFAAVSNAPDAQLSRSESLSNEALQKSNLGRYAEADSLFSRAAQFVGSDELIARQLRNYRAMHELNQGDFKNALVELDKLPPRIVAVAVGGSAGGLNIDASTANRLNADSKLGHQLGTESAELLPAEKLEILDAQALQLRGTALRLGRDMAAAVKALDTAAAKLQAVRNGTVTSVIWMRAQILGDLAAIAEESGNAAEANRLFREGVQLIEAGYPGSAALLSARARLAGYLARSGQVTEAEAMFREIVHSQPDASNLPPSFAYVLRPYVDLLLKRPNDPAALAEIFAASQLMVRPGLAQTQAILARELTGGGDEASRLFRQSISLSRLIERNRVELARLDLLPKPSIEETTRMRILRAALAQSAKDQSATQSALASFPRYRAVSSEVISLAEMQRVLHPDEAYYRMLVVGETIYAMVIRPTAVEVKKLKLTTKQLSDQVDALRETISTVEAGQRQTFAFDVALAHEMYKELFAPFSASLAGVTSLIFEPDGAMLRLPPNILVMDQASVDAYTKRAARGGEEAEFDFRGINWFGRDRDISTSVSPRSFAQLRAAPPSSGSLQYLGLGENTPPSAANAAMVPAVGDRDCTLPLSSWSNPISAKELQTASGILSQGNPNSTQIITRDQFTDTGIEQRKDLSDFRILHFATHGVVTSRAAKCAAQPALLTSFGGEGSDGLLTFREIFDLKLDADVVVLSACDTAGMASSAATQSAGLARGGDVALDGLVRAFVGAGGRLVVASHWPVPDDYNATQRLITGLFSAPAGEGMATALRQSQRTLMDDANTSHPFYWAAFALVGDGERPLVQKNAQVAIAK